MSSTHLSAAAALHTIEAVTTRDGGGDGGGGGAREARDASLKTSAHKQRLDPTNDSRLATSLFISKPTNAMTKMGLLAAISATRAAAAAL